MDSNLADALTLPFIDTTKGLQYRLSNPDGQTSLRTIDSSFITDRIFQVGLNNPNPTSEQLSFGLHLTTTQLEKPLQKTFPDEEDLDEDDESPDSFTVVVEDINKPLYGNNGSVDPTTISHDNKVVGFISATFSSWNSRLVISDIEIDPSYRRQGIARNLIRFAESLGSSRFPVRQMWLEVSNVNYPAIRSYLRMGFKVAGLDVALYVGTPAEGEFAIFMWKEIVTGH
ncbi:GNAT family N-acetyltransferase [Aspergillus alliaceus]|uniref:GNAT family N-acetyltransferase n=1 Tax=Petromyces alliaceus TaxID=209559 RepID=UPI0012A44C42|nr:acyl-CoA N-acyltransferase [Aspergillus alliaceus]KAB8230771.1 acyl-CoA N-acyltransferase [Aspergillus alliaceus]